jgi:hypothetical protein
MGGRHKRLGLAGSAGLLLVAGWLEVLVSALDAQVPPGYELIRITDDPYFDRWATVNNCGQVVFSKRINNSIDQEEIFLWDNGQLIQITDDNVNDSFPDINDNGTIVWSRRVGPDDGSFEIATYRNGQTTILTDNTVIDYEPRVNESEHVTWEMLTGEGCTGANIMLFDGTIMRQLTDDGFSNQSPDINRLGQIAWTRYNFCVNPWVGTIMLRATKDNAPVTDGSHADQSVAISDAMSIVWDRGLPTGHAIWRWDAGNIFELTPNGSYPHINSRGTVIFNRWYGNWVYQVWMVHDGVFTQMTDTLDTNISSSINDHGDIALTIGGFPNDDVFLLRATTRNADVDFDGDVDLAEIALFQRCLSAVRCALGPSCTLCDIDVDGAVQLQDFRESVEHLTGPH